MNSTNLIEIFCILDEFCKFFAPQLKKHMIDDSGKLHRNRPCIMSDSEIMTILIMYHQSHYIDLKAFYLHEICEHHRSEFPRILSYNRFVERQQKVSMLFYYFYKRVPWVNVPVSPS